MEKERKVLVVGDNVEIVSVLKQLGVQVLAACSVIDENSSRVLNVDEVVCVGPEENNNFIFNIVEVATSKNVDAIYISNDLLSRHPEFIKICKAYNLVVISPVPDDTDSIKKQIISALNLKTQEN